MRFGFALRGEEGTARELWTNVGVVVAWPLFVVALLFEARKWHRERVDPPVPVARARLR
jgi:hypothetical protein